MLITNILSVVIAGISSAIIGFIWFHPRVFGRSWMRMSGIQPEHTSKGSATLFGFLGLASSIVMAAVLRSESQGIATLADALVHTLTLWFGLVATVLLGVILWERKPFSLYLITAGYWLVAVMAMTVILFYLHG